MLSPHPLLYIILRRALRTKPQCSARFYNKVWEREGASARLAAALLHALQLVVSRPAIAWEREGLNPSQGGVRIIPPRIKVYNSTWCGILPSTGKSLNTGRPPKRSEHGKHQIQSKRQTVFRGERKLQGAVGQAGESLQERIRREELQKLQVKFAKIKATDPVGRFDFLRTRSALSRIRSGAISLH